MLPVYLRDWLYNSKQKMAEHDKSHLFEHGDLCNHLLEGIGASSQLDIRKSDITGAGSALFTKTDLRTGDEVFRSSPLVSTALNTTQNICGWCFKDGESRVLSSGRFRSKNDPIDVFPTCHGCQVDKYCSDVS